MRARQLALSVILLCDPGCSDPWLANVPPKYVEVAKIHHSSCGGCHARIEPAERSRDQFAAALARHHGRVKMSDADWSRLLDYLSRQP